MHDTRARSKLLQLLGVFCTIGLGPKIVAQKDVFVDHRSQWRYLHAFGHRQTAIDALGV